MHVLIDASSLLKELTGIGVYTYHLLEEIASMDPSVSFTVFLNALKNPTPYHPAFSSQSINVVRRRFPGKLLLELWRRFPWPTIDSLAHVTDVDVFHSPNYFYQPSCARHVVATVHDLAFFKRADYGARYSGQYHRQMLPKTLSKASKIIAISNAGKKDIKDYFNIPDEKIEVIHLGLSKEFLTPGPTEENKRVLMAKGFPEKYLLSVGTIEPRKNFPVLIEAFAELRKQMPDLHLVLAGRFAEDIQNLRRIITEFNLTSHVHFTGYVDLNVLVKLYSCAMISIFPSWDEGFGLSPLEAIAAGSNVIASDIAAHREVLGDTCYFFTPTDPFQLALLIRKLIASADIRERQRRAGSERVKSFTWRETARKHLEIYRSLCAS